MKTRTLLAALATAGLGLGASAAPLGIGTVMNFDFGATPSAAGFFNDDGGVVGASFGAGSLIDSTGTTVDGVGFSLDSAFSNSDAAIGAIDPSISGLGFDASHAEDFAGRVTGGIMTLTFTGLTDNIGYDFTGVSAFDGRDLVIKYAGGFAGDGIESGFFDTTGANPTATLSNMRTNGLGELSIVVTSDAANQAVPPAASVAVINAFTLTASGSVTPVPPPANRAIQAGDKIGFDFGPTPTDTTGNDWVETNGGDLADGEVHNLDGVIMNGITVLSTGTEFSNNDGSDADFSTSLAGQAGIDPHFEDSVVTDLAGVFTEGANPWTYLIQGLDDSLTYNIWATAAAEFAFSPLDEEEMTIGGVTSEINRGTIASPTFHEFLGLSPVNGEIIIDISQDDGTAFNPILNGILLEAVGAFDPADLDQDGDVDDADFGIAFAAFTGPNNGPSSNPAADLDGDGDVDDADFGIAFAAFTGPGGAQVPEPASLALLGLGGLLIARRRRA